MALPIINSRADLDCIEGTQAHADFVKYLKGSMTVRVNTAEYPEDYNDADYDGPEIEPAWVDTEDLSTAARFGFSKEALLALDE